MPEKYKQGMVAQLLGGGKESSGGKLAALFTVPESVHSTEPGMPETAPSKKKKKKKVETVQAEEAAISPPKKKVRVDVHENVKKSGTTGISQQRSEGFDPPPGIVHEALVESSNRSGKKRKKTASDDEDSDDDHPRKGIKEDKRPRRDRQKKTNEKRTVFVGNVPLSLTKDKKGLKRLFKQFGEIDSVRFRCAPVADTATKKRVAVITKEFHEKRHNISAYICFKEEEAAKKAVSLNGHLIDGLHLRVDTAKPVLKNLNKRSVFVGNLPFAIEEESIRQHFEDCGEIENVRVVRDRKTNLGKGFCYILFKSSDSVSLALKLKNSELEKRQLRVERCVDVSQKDAKGKTLKKSNDMKQTNTDRKVKKKKQTSAGPKANNTQTGTEQKAKRKKRMWQPTNASGTQILKSYKTALKKKQRKGEKKKKQRSKGDEVTRILGPLQQPPVKSVKNGSGRKPKLNRKKDMKGQKKGKKNVR